MGGETKDLRELMAQTDDLDKAQAALVRERVIRDAMRETGESREIVADMLDACVSMDQEAILDLVDGEPTTLHAALQRYVDGLESNAHSGNLDEVAADLNSLLAYPWPGSPDAEALTREIHESYLRLAPARGFEMVPWDRLSSAQRELALAVVADLIGRDVIRKRP